MDTCRSELVVHLSLLLLILAQHDDVKHGNAFDHRFEREARWPRYDVRQDEFGSVTLTCDVAVKAGQ